MLALKISLIIISFTMLLLCVLPFMKSDNWVFRLSEFPRGQKLFLTILSLVLYAALFFKGGTFDFIFLLLNGLIIFYLFALILPYTPFGKKQMVRVREPLQNKTVKIFICNVYQPNTKYDKLIKIIRKYDPDMVLVAEADLKWRRGLRELERNFPNIVFQEQDNTYGMILYSKLELVEPEVRFLVDKAIPSIHSLVRLPSGDIFKLYFVHPMPPVPTENHRSTERDKELLIVGKEAEKLKLPVVVAGDLNDVAWSYTTKLFLKISKLLDPRRGRGFFNTFHAKAPIIRVPLDHVFCSAEWQLVKIERTRNFNSDHFPIYVEICLKPQQKYQHEVLEPDKEDRAEADDKIRTHTNKGGENK